MPQDPNLYGQRAPKRQKREMPISSSLSFASQLTSLVAAPSSSSNSKAPKTTAEATAGPKGKKDLFTSAKAKRKLERQEKKACKQNGNKLSLKSPVDTPDEKAELDRTRRTMERKARLYAAMKRGDYVGDAHPLVDFDRKWAEEHGAHSDDEISTDSSSSEDEPLDTTIIEYEDEFGRQRTGTRADAQRMRRRLARAEHSAADLETFSARPAAPQNIIVGDAVQTDAFAPAAGLDAMEELARKRDRSATPPELKHYDAGSEIRTRGVAFYAFSRDEETRQREMAALEEERRNTEKAHREREEKVAERKRAMERRRREVGERRAKRMADSFLETLGMDMRSLKGPNNVPEITADPEGRVDERGEVGDAAKYHSANSRPASA